MKPTVKEIRILKEDDEIQKHTDTSNFHTVALPIDDHVVSKGISKPSGLPVSQAVTSTKHRATANDSGSRTVVEDNEIKDEDEEDQTEETFGNAPSTDLERFSGLLEWVGHSQLRSKLLNYFLNQFKHTEITWFD